MFTLAALPSVVLVGFAVPAGASTAADASTAAGASTAADPSAPPPASIPTSGNAPVGSLPPLTADGVNVGSGSYAPTPPTSIKDYAAVQKTVDQHVYIDPSQAGKPVPTNQWWTDLIISKFSGDMWAYPLVSSTSADGTKVSYPKDWNANGGAMKVEHGVTVSGDVIPNPGTSDEVLADFEDGIPSGWTTTGSAFSVSSSVGKGQSAADGWLGRKYLTSWDANKGDGAKGTITSSAFTIDHSHLTFQIAGGNRPDDEAVQLLVGGKVARTTTGTDSETLRWADWDVSEFAGQQAQVRVVDLQDGGWYHVMVDQLMLTDEPAAAQQRYSTLFKASEADALRWGDYDISWRMPQAGDGGQHMDVTSVQGNPYEWFEYSGETPRLTLENGATITDGDGKAISFPFTGSRFAIHQGGHVFGVHVADDTTFSKSGNVIRAGSGSYLVLSAVPDEGLTLDQLHEHAFAVPRDTRMDYTYDKIAGQVEQKWTVKTDTLQGTDHDTVQGWLQHQYADAKTNLHFTGAEYATPRGVMRTSIGHDDAKLDYAFTGLTPIGATPDLSDKSEFRATMRKYIADYSTVKWKGGDTYWDGKNVLQLAEYMTVAKQLGDTEDEQKLHATLERALSDWFTYTNGEKENFFAMYPTWKALIGFADSYGSAQMNDQMFHYGYFAVAAALLGKADPTWAKRYEGMATLVTKEYANDDRSDSRFPYLRTFGIWEGHSNAAGFSSPGGNNQESSSEAIQSEAGLFLLGTVLGNERMQATGAMEYVTERAAVRAYYQNARGNESSSSYDGNGAFPTKDGKPLYDHAQVGILQDGGNAYATYFSGDPAWIHGIQWMPTAPWFDYFGWDPQFSRSIMEEMMAERPGSLGKGVRGANAGRIQMLTKKWYGIGTYGADAIKKDQKAAIGELQDAIRAAEKNDPGYVTAKVAANPLWDATSGTLLVSTDAKGNVVFPEKYWTPATLPASIVPAEISGKEADKQPSEWATQSPLLPYLSTDYKADDATTKDLYSVDFANYAPGKDTAHAAAVFSDMGDALGEVVLGYLAQYDPATYADIHDALWKAKDPAVTGKSMAGMVYYQGMSNLEVGTEVTTRHTSDPLSQVFRNAEGSYSYVLDNTDDVQHSYDVYDGTEVIGSIAVPANTQITSHMDARLTGIDVRADGTPRTIVPGSSTTFTATGRDQYGATMPLTGVQWKVSVGSVTADGDYHATTPSDSVTLTATVGDVHDTATFRVAPAPTLTNIAVTPGFDRLVVGTPRQFSAAGLDQYGDPIALPAAVTWSSTGPGTVSATGVLTTTAPGAGTVVATESGTVEGSAVVASVATMPDAALTSTATASSSLGSKPSMAVDGNGSTRWESAHGVDDVDFTVDLGRQTDVTDVAIRWENAAASSYDLQFADSAEGPWRTVQHVTKSSAAADDLPVTGTTRYVRMHGISRMTAYGYSIWDFHVSGTPAASTITPTIALVGPRAANVLTGATSRRTAYAFDGSGAGGPVSGSAGTPNAAIWTLEGPGSIATDGTVTAGDTAGVTSTATATIGGTIGRGTVTTVAQAAGSTPPPTTGGDTGAGVSRDNAIGKTVTTSSNERADLAGNKAVDGNSDTRWSSAAHEGEWIAVDLGSSLPIDRIGLDWEAAHAEAYQLQVRDSTDDPWRTVVDEQASDGHMDTHDPSDVSARYVRMLGGTRSSVYGYSLFAFHVFSKQGSPTVDLTRGATATSSSNESASVGAANAIDGDDTSRWASGHSDDQWLAVDLGAQHELHSASIAWEGAYGRAYRFEGRNRTTGAWTTITSVAESDGGSDTVDLDGSWRYVRLQGVHRATPYGYSLYSLTVR